MKSIKEITQYEYTIKKSVFITTLIPCNNIEDVPLYIEEYSKDDASHNCVCYRIGNLEKADDDGEPSGTAGLPMLNVIQRQDLTNILVIVTRYFGGIKLGAGGLTRAYTNSVADALKEATIVEKELVKKYEVIVDYHYIKKLEHMMNQANIDLVNTEYDEQVHYTMFLKDESFLNQIQDLTSGNFSYDMIGEDYRE